MTKELVVLIISMIPMLELRGGFAPLIVLENSQFLRLCSIAHNRKNWTMIDITYG